eukprot:GHVS01058156.1.p1 GENE.GHVS01058156.1~~GHVS01058156.1.p1  ORF type:complete len:344 (-),score=52.09 GHVS01058156.1:375-1406(-)
MADILPDRARHLAPYINRADELHEHCPMASFYCRLFVGEQLSLLRAQPGPPDPDLDKLLMDQIDKAEQLKSLSNSDPSVAPFTKQEFENFCLGVFKRAYDDDQSGIICQSTLQRYFCAGLFLDVLGQFGPLSPEMEQKRKYSRWRATCIKRSLDLGETPSRPDEQSLDDGSGLTDEFGKLHVSDTSHKITPSSSNRPAPHASGTTTSGTSPVMAYQNQSVFSPSSHATHTGMPSDPSSPIDPPTGRISVRSTGSLASAPEAASRSDGGDTHGEIRSRVSGGVVGSETGLSRLSGRGDGGEVNANDITRALKHAQQAVAALNFDDGPTARKELQEALSCLGDGD